MITRTHARLLRIWRIFTRSRDGFPIYLCSEESELKSPHGKVFAPRDQRDDDKGCRCCCCCCKNRGQDPDEDSEKAKPKGKIGFVAPSVRLHLPAVRQLQGSSVVKTRVVPTTLPVVHLEMLPLRKATSLLRVELRPSLKMRVEPQRKVIRRKIQI